MSRRKQRSQLDAIDQINITPLLDLTFLLLIVFMLTMPLMEYGTSVNPPEMNSKQLPEDHFRSVSLTKDGLIEYDKQIIPREALMERLREVKAAEPDTVLLLRADGSRTYLEVMELMRDIKNSGFTNISLVTQAESKR